MALRRGRTRRIPAICFAVAVGVLVWIAYKHFSNLYRSVPSREAGAPPPVEAARGSQSADAESTASDAENQLADAAGKVADQLRPLQWEGVVWDGKSDMPPEKLREVLSITQRFRENFRNITTLKLHDEQTWQPLMDLPADMIKAWNKNTGRDLDVEIDRSPLFFKASGKYGPDTVDITVTPAAKIHRGEGIGYAESMAPTYIDGETYWTDMNLRFDYAVEKDRALPPELLNLDALKGLIPDPTATYDVLSLRHRDGFDMHYWFNKSTGMLDFSIQTKWETAQNESPFGRVMLITYQRAGESRYFKDCYCFTDTSYFVNKVDGGRKPSRRFDVKIERHFTNVMINGISAQ